MVKFYKDLSNIISYHRQRRFVGAHRGPVRTIGRSTRAAYMLAYSYRDIRAKNISIQHAYRTFLKQIFKHYKFVKQLKYFTAKS